MQYKLILKNKKTNQEQICEFNDSFFEPDEINSTYSSFDGKLSYLVKFAPIEEEVYGMYKSLEYTVEPLQKCQIYTRQVEEEGKKYTAFYVDKIHPEPGEPTIYQMTMINLETQKKASRDISSAQIEDYEYPEPSNCIYELRDKVKSDTAKDITLCLKG